jgi:uncharacterized protein (DUF58 family)
LPAQTNGSPVQQVNGYPRRRLRLTREGWAALAITGWVLAAALMSHASLVLLVFCLLVMALVLGSVQTFRNLRGLQVVRRLPSHAVAGRAFGLEFHAHNRRLAGAARAIAVASEIQPPPEQQPSLFLPSIGRRGHVTRRVQIMLPNRGLYRFGELEVSTRYPFGFLERSLQCGAVQELLVFPRLGRLRRRFLEVQREQHLHQHGRRPGRSMIEADYHGLREFRPGDSSRWIHWPTTARRARLMVREFEARRNRDVAVLLEPWLPPHADARERAMLELAISFTATLCVELCRRPSLHIVLGIAGNQPIVRHGQSSQRLLRDLLGQLAVLQGSDNPQWELLIQEMPMAWINTMRITAVSPRRLELGARSDPSQRTNRGKWHRLARRLIEVDASSGQLSEYFELSDPTAADEPSTGNR